MSASIPKTNCCTSGAPTYGAARGADAASCRELAPQLQYMDVVNAIAAELAGDAKAPPVAYLAYHDTIEPHPGLRPLVKRMGRMGAARAMLRARDRRQRVRDQPAAARIAEALSEIFDGRCHLFEYYADAILFGGLGFATPAVIARDLRAYRALGIPSVSCLTFGAYSAMAYPVNLEAFVRATRSPDFESDATIADTAAGRHPACSSEMAAAYNAIEHASRLVLDYGDVMRPAIAPERAARKRTELREAVIAFDEALAAADQIERSLDTPLAAAEHDLWRYSADVLASLSDYIAACEETGAQRRTRGEAAIAKVAGAIERIRAIEPEIKGTWGAYDLEWIRELWLAALRRGLDGGADPAQGLL